MKTNYGEVPVKLSLLFKDCSKPDEELKEIVFQYYMRLNSLYHIEDFTEFDKVWLAYDFIKRHIRKC